MSTSLAVTGCGRYIKKSKLTTHIKKIFPRTNKTFFTFRGNERYDSYNSMEGPSYNHDFVNDAPRRDFNRRNFNRFRYIQDIFVMVSQFMFIGGKFRKKHNKHLKGTKHLKKSHLNIKS